MEQVGNQLYSCISIVNNIIVKILVIPENKTKSDLV